MDAERARAIVDAGIARYVADRHARVAEFVDRHFSAAGTLALHRAALGWDILRAPANLTLAAPELLRHLAASGLRGLGARGAAAALDRRHFLLRTRLAREIESLVRTELLELPGEASGRDALAETILGDPEVNDAVHSVLAALAARGDPEAQRARLESLLATYAGTRAAAAEVATGLLTLSAGALALQKLTPGAATLGPALAGMMAQQAAIATFPLGTGLGGIWYGMFPAGPTLGLTMGLTGGLMLALAGFAAFSGLVTDPIQRRLGWHARRLHRMIDALDRQLRDPAAPGYAARDQYVARLMDLFDVLGAVARSLR